jgi:hypothetical protein
MMNAESRSQLPSSSQSKSQFATSIQARSIAKSSQSREINHTHVVSTLKKGFLNKKTDYDTKPSREFIELKPKSDRNAALVIPEVQQEMRRSFDGLLNEKSWMTQELMQAIVGDPVLSKSLTDPRFQDALNLLQRDPQEAKRKYERDVAVTEMITKFMSLFGSHFEKLGKAKSKIEADELHLMLNADSELKRLVEFMHKGGQLDPRRLHPTLLSKVKLLIDKGLLRIQT